MKSLFFSFILLLSSLCGSPSAVSDNKSLCQNLRPDFFAGHGRGFEAGEEPHEVVGDSQVQTEHHSRSASEH